MIQGFRAIQLGLLTTFCLFGANAQLTRATDSIIGPNYGTIPIQSMELSALGLSATVQLTNQQAPGYVPVRITVTGRGTVPADEHLIFRFATRPGGEMPPANGLIVDVPITIAQGSKTTATTKYLPKWSLGQTASISVLDGDRLLEDSVTNIGDASAIQPLRFRLNNWGMSRVLNLKDAGFAHECRQDWLFISDTDIVVPATVPDLTPFLSDTSQNGTLSTEPIKLGFTEGVERYFHCVGQKELPADWRGYQSYDVVVLNSVALARIAVDPVAFEPLRQWILQGGSMVVYNAAGIQDVTARFRFQVAPDMRSTKLIETIARKHVAEIQTRKENAEQIIAMLKAGNDADFAEKQRLTEQISQSYGFVPDISDFSRSIDFFQLLLDQSNEAIDEIPKKLTSQIEAQHAGAGVILAILSTSQHPVGDQGIPTRSDWYVVKRFLDDRGSPMVRGGVEPLCGNHRFREWMISSVMQPPVYSFIGLLTGFVILVGPIAYRQTAKHGRSHLMFLIAPVLAVFTTLAMLAYGIVADGFGTRGRIRQLTWVDGQSGDAGERVRATYFAGIRPADGLRFPGKSMVMRQAEATDVSWEESVGMPPTTLGHVTIGDDSQVFGSSFLPSRDQRQFILHVPRPGVGAVQLLSTQSDDSEPSLVSTMQFPIRHVIARDRDGNFWSTENLDSGKTNRCERLSPREASRWLGKFYNDHRLVAETSIAQEERGNRPAELDPLNSIILQVDGSVRNEVGIFEAWLRENLQTTGEIPPLHFIATAKVSDDVVAIEGCEVVDSIRYVFGTLK